MSSRRKTRVGRMDVMVECFDCPWEYMGRNGLGLAAQHHDRTGHFVMSLVQRTVSYGTNPHDREDPE